MNPDTSGQDLAITCALAAHDLRAEDIRVLDVRGSSTLTDFLVICSGNSMPHLKAVASEIEQKARETLQDAPLSSEGTPQSRWLILDYVNVMIHIMLTEMREHYALEDLWGDAKEIKWQPADFNPEA